MDEIGIANDVSAGPWPHQYLYKQESSMLVDVYMPTIAEMKLCMTESSLLSKMVDDEDGPSQEVIYNIESVRTEPASSSLTTTTRELISTCSISVDLEQEVKNETLWVSSDGFTWLSLSKTVRFTLVKDTPELLTISPSTIRIARDYANQS